jgi:hypothetical protein
VDIDGRPAFWSLTNGGARRTGGLMVRDTSGAAVEVKQKNFDGGRIMSQAETVGTGPAQVLVAVAVGRNSWASQQATLHYESSRLIKAEGTGLTQAGPKGLTGTLYVVKDFLCRDNRRVMRVERQKIVNGKVVDTQNWGELEDAGLQRA